jgi:hypothetical protein
MTWPIWKAAGIPGCWLVAGLVAVLLVVLAAGALTIILVKMTCKKDRPDTIRAVADLLDVLIPWPTRRRDE